MAKSPRNFAIEYRVRIIRGRARGLTIAQARGHAATPAVSKRQSAKAAAASIEAALNAIVEKAASITKAAREFHVAPERLRQYLHQNTEAKFVGRKWRIKDKRPATLLIAENGRLSKATFPRHKKSEIAAWWNKVAKFLDDPTKANLAAIQGYSVRDIHGRLHRLEDRPNMLRKLDSIGELSFLSIYADTPGEGSIHG